ncbi:MAG: cellulase family glycosylhydrolase [Candidatus Neomarinimicrobiota bacterium]
MRIVIKYFFILNIIFSQGFLHVENGEIVEGNGDPILLRGFGLGGWLVPEGYMLSNLGYIEGFESPTEIENHIEDLIGSDLAEEFWELYRSNYVNKTDIDQLAEWGMNHIRVPFHYKQFSETPGTVNPLGYEIVDSLLAWCEPYNMYIILDMHCAPGAQNGGPISDSDGTARLWLEDGFKEHAIEIWESIATYYSDNTLIGGYDLINEPVLPDGVSSMELRELYINITNAIRAVDQNHILFVEGNWYGTDFTDLTPPWDENMSYAFHKYWGDVTVNTIQSYLSMSSTYNIPLWNGETGENSNHWNYEIVKLCEENNIGWNWWTHKKIEKISVPFSAIVSPAYQSLLNYWNGSGSQPTVEYAQAGLWEMANSLKLENCIVKSPVISSIIDPTFGDASQPYKEHSIPGVIAAVDYDIGPNFVAYSDNEFMNTGQSGSNLGGANGVYNIGWVYRNDGVDIEYNGDDGISYNVGWTEAGEWLGYTIEDVTPGTYDIEIRIGGYGGILLVQLDYQNIAVIDIPNTGGWSNWQPVTIQNVNVSEGEKYLKLQVVENGFNIKKITFESLAKIEDKSILSNQFSINKIYPNPFNPSTQIVFNIEAQDDYIAQIFNIKGQKVYDVLNENLQPGKHTLIWNAKDNYGNKVPSGIYVMKISNAYLSKQRKLVLMK